MGDKNLRHLKIIEILRTEDDICLRVVKEYVCKRFVCGGGCFRMDIRYSHCMQIRVFSIEKLIENSKKCLTMF